MAATMDLGNLMVHLRMNATQYMKTMRAVETRMKVASQRMTQIGTQMSLKVTLPIVAMGAAATKAFANFDDAMTKSLSIMNGITPQIRKQMEDLAIEISTNGVTSARDLAKSYFFLASAGLDAAQSMAALSQVNKFAIAGAFDMATATDLATDAQSALGLTVKDAQVNLMNMTRVTDVLVGANTLANASTEQFALALTSQAGPAMKAYNIQLEEGVAVLAAYADQGIKAQVAGNLFGRMLRLMTKGFKENESSWRRLGINIFDVNEELKPMSMIIGDLSGALGELSTKQKIATLDMLGFKARSQQAILPLLGLGDKIAEYNEKLLEMDGITKRVAEKQLKSFSAQMAIVKNNVKALGIEIGKTLAPALKAIGEQIKRLTTFLRNLDKETLQTVLVISSIAAAIGPVLIAAGLFVKALGLMKVALVAVRIATLALIAHPVIGLLILAVAGVTAAFIKGAQEAAAYNAAIAAGKRVAEQGAVAWKNFAESIETVDGIMNTEKARMILKIYKESADNVKRLTAELIKQKAVLDSTSLAGKDLDRRHAAKERIKEINAAIMREEEFIKKIEIRKDREAAVIQQAAKDAFPDIPDKPKEGKETRDFFDTKKFDARVNDWIDASKEVSENIADAFTSGLDAISQGVTDLLLKGEADFASIAQSIFAETTQQIIKGGIASAIGPLFAGGGKKEGDGGGGEAATQAAMVNEAAAGMNVEAANTMNASSLMNQATGFLNQTVSGILQFLGFQNQTSATVEQSAAATMTGAAATNFTAAGIMMEAAIINAGASAGGAAHRGGMVGSMNNPRSISNAAMAGAPRFHNGLADDEFATILQRGEVVLDKSNVAELKRDSGQGGGGSGGGSVVNNYNISAVDAPGVSKFFKKHRKTMMNANRRSRSENNAARRGSS